MWQLVNVCVRKLWNGLFLARRAFESCGANYANANSSRLSLKSIVASDDDDDDVIVT